MKHRFLAPIRLSALPLLLSISAPAALAHHSSTPHFDRSETIVKDAVLTDVKLVNPHSYIYFDVTENGETNNWRCELSSAAQLKRLGWTDETLKPGQKFTMIGSPAWREDNVCLTNIIRLEDGTQITRSTNLSGTGVNGYVTAEEEKVDFTTRPKYLANGQPNFTGNWRTVSFGRGAALAAPRESAEDYKVTEAGRAAQIGYDMAFDDPVLRCHYVNLVKAWNHDAHINQIEQTEDKLILRYGFMDVTRIVHLNETRFPDHIPPSDIGYSIGRWEGETLIVETKGFEPGVLEHSSGVKHSDQLHALERFYIDPKNNFLIRESVLTDPLYLSEPKTTYDGQELVNLPAEEYGCTELSGTNNIRPGESVTYHRGTGIESHIEKVEALSPDLSSPDLNSQGQNSQGQNAPITDVKDSEVKAGTIGPRVVDEGALAGGGAVKWLAIVIAVLAALGGFMALRRKGG